MKTEQRAGRQLFAWRRTSVLRDHFALHAGDGEVAVLRIGGLGGPVAQLDAGDSSLVFLRDGLAGRCIRVREASTNVSVGWYEQDWRGAGGTLWLADGGQLRWMRTGHFRSFGLTVANLDGTALVRFAPDGTMANLVTEDPATADLLLVLALGWLLVVLARDQVS